MAITLASQALKVSSIGAAFQSIYVPQFRSSDCLKTRISPRPLSVLRNGFSALLSPPTAVGFCFSGPLARRQRVIGPLAGLAGDAGGVSVFSQDSRALVSPVEHVGKHSDGVAG